MKRPALFSEQLYLQNKAVPVPSRYLSCSQPGVRETSAVPLTLEIVPQIPISTLAPYTPSTQWQWCRLHVNHMPLHHLKHSDEYCYYNGHPNSLS